MPSPNLDRLCGAGLLHAEPPAADEYAGLLRSGLARLRNPANRYQRQPTWTAQTPEGRWRVYDYDELIARENEVPAEANLGAAEVKAHSAGRSHKASLDIFRLKDESLADSDNLPPPEVIAQEIVADLEAALEQFRLIAGDLNGGGAGSAV